MRIAYFPNQTSLNSAPVLKAVLEGCKRFGINLVTNDMNADAAIIWSVLWNGRMQANQQVHAHYRSLNKPVIIIEVGALHRNVTWKIALNNITASGFYGHLDNLDWDRPKKLNVQLRTPGNPGPEIVIALQHSKSLQTETMGNMTQWVEDTVKILKGVTDRPIVVRPHPRNKINLPSGLVVETPSKIADTYDSYDLRFNSYAIVNYNSGVGIQAALHGVRPLVDISSLAAPVGIAINEIEQPYNINRDQWLTEICHTEYTIEEIQQGIWISRLNIM